MRRFVIGDIHGAFHALIQVLQRSEFDYDNDKLIVLGDTCDGWPFVRHSFDLLSKVKNLIYVIGNHDVFCLNGLRDKMVNGLWFLQGGRNTLKSYGYELPPEKEKLLTDFSSTVQHEFSLHIRHYSLLKNAYAYHIEDNMLFVHGGIDVNQKDMKKQKFDTLIWDRQLIQTAVHKSMCGRDWKALDFDTIFIGHTSTEFFKKDGQPILEPIFACNVIDMDTGAGWSGKLTIMDIDTKEYWQSDLVTDLYPNQRGRG